MTSRNHCRRGVVSKNVVMIAGSAILIVAAAVVFTRTGPEEPPLVDMSGTTMRVKCTKCGAEWDMPFTEYEALAQSASADGKAGIACQQCGEADSAWKTGGLNMANLKVTDEMAQDAWKNTGEEVQPTDESTEETKPTKPAASFVEKSPG